MESGDLSYTFFMLLLKFIPNKHLHFGDKVDVIVASEVETRKQGCLGTTSNFDE